MLQLAKIIPDVEVLLALEPEELGAKLLFLVRERLVNGMFHPGNLSAELWNVVSGPDPYPRSHQQEISLALAEAWAWVEAQGLIVPAEGTNGSKGFRRLSRRARKFEDEADFSRYAYARALPKHVLHPTIAQTVWMAFMRGEFDVAVFQAMKAVEVAVRTAAGYTDADYGTDMIIRAFNENNGPLRDRNGQQAERIALRNLFAGAHGSYKNPHSHRNVPLDDPNEATEIIMLANHLLRIVDSRRTPAS